MRPWRTGTRSGSRVVFCSSSNATGSGRSAAGSHPAWPDGPTCSRAALPRALLSSTLRCVILLTGFFSDRDSSVLAVALAIVASPDLSRALARFWLGRRHPVELQRTQPPTGVSLHEKRHELSN